MKKSKLLIPALSIASVGAVVAPMVTSCTKSSVFMNTTDIEYFGEMHDAVASSDAWTLDKGTEEYFKDRKYLADDCLTSYAYVYGALAKSRLELAEAKNIDVKINIQVNDLTIGEAKEVIVGTASVATKGYLVSGTITINQNVSYDAKVEDETITQDHYDETIVSTMTFSNCFAFLTLGETAIDWNVNLYGCKNASDSWISSEETSRSYVNTTTYKDETTATTNYSRNDSDHASAKKDDDQTLIDVLGQTYVTSNYLSKVNHVTE